MNYETPFLKVSRFSILMTSVNFYEYKLKSIRNYNQSSEGHQKLSCLFHGNYDEGWDVKLIKNYQQPKKDQEELQNPPLAITH